jgi:predicted Zn finger-like uncharacterized protein
MILTCPECATRYQTDASHFSPDGRKVRCAKCGHVWFQAAPGAEADAPLEDVAASPTPAEPAVAPRASEPAHAQTEWQEPPGRVWPLERLGLGLGWTALAAVVLAVGWSAVHFRSDIANLWPQSSTLYAVAGMPVNTRGLEFRDRSAHYETEAGQDVLVITGDLVNITRRELSVPAIRVSLTDGDKRELYHWSFSPGVSVLRPGQLAAFHTRLPSPPAAARHIELRLSEHLN